jgi:hypothetical protein
MFGFLAVFQPIPQNDRLKVVRGLAMLKYMLNKIRELLNRVISAREVRYTSVPIWRPWRDF